MISSLGNGQVKNLIQLQKKAKARNEQSIFVVEGVKMFEEAKANGLIKAYVSESFYKEMREKEPDYFDGFEYEIVSDGIFKEISDTVTPQGILALVKKPEYVLEELISKADASLLVLEAIRDPGNLGTMLRTAEGAGMTGVVISRESVDIYNPKVIRSTMGSVYRVPFVYAEDIRDAVRKMKQAGIRIFAAHLDGINDYDRESYQGKCGILIGNEANGLSSELSKEADCLVKIPMLGKVESLNAAVAAAVLMYETARQRRQRNRKN